MLRKAILIIVLAAGLPVPLSAQVPAALRATKPLVITPLRGGVYLVEGGITHTGFVVGDKGVIAIDPQMFMEAATRELAEIAKITPKPVTTVIVSHSDPDHIGGLPAYPAGVTVISQENARTEMVAALADPNPRGTPPPPELKDFLPTHTIRRSETIVIDGVRVVLTHVASGHTDGDLVIFLPAQKVVFTGDLVTIDDPNNPTAGLYPVIHLNKFGSSLGWIKAMKAMLALDADTFIAGHGTARQTRAKLQEAVVATERRRAEIKALFDQGKSLAEVQTALHDPPPSRFPSFTETTYQELLQE